MSTDLNHTVAMDQHALAGVVGDILSKSMEPWFIRRLTEDEIISAIEQLNVVLVRKRAQKERRAA